MISQHFSWEEAAHTDTGLPNEIPDALCANVQRLAEEVLEPLRVLLGPLHVNSWYRSPEVNEAVGGEKSSYHLQGLAVDVVPMGSCLDKFKMALTLLDELPIDKIILETRKSQWIHIQTNMDGMPPRHQALTAKSVNGKMVYSVYEA